MAVECAGAARALVEGQCCIIPCNSFDMAWIIGCCWAGGVDRLDAGRPLPVLQHKSSHASTIGEAQ